MCERAIYDALGDFQIKLKKKIPEKHLNACLSDVINLCHL